MTRPRSLAFATLVLAAALTGCGDTPSQPTLHPPAEIRRTLAAVAPSAFTQVSAGFLSNSCGVRGDASILCWGDNRLGQSSPPAGAFTEVSAGEVHTCAVRVNATLACWGYNADGRASAPTGAFIHVSASRAHTCAIRSTGTVVCWGENSQGQASPPSGTFTQISAASYHTCGVRTDGTAACWGRNLAGNASPPPGTFVQVAASYQDTCGLRTDGTVACWGYDGNGQATAPAGTFVAVSMGQYHACGVRIDGTIACWGADDIYSRPPTGNTFTAISTGLFHNCALTSGGGVACWGSNSSGQSAPPPHLPQSINFTSTPPQPAILASSYAAGATGGASGNPVTFTSLTPAVCTTIPVGANGSTVSLSAVGTCTLAADQLGDAMYLTAPRVTQSFDVVYAFTGFFAPVDNPGPNDDVVNRAKAGAGIAVKFALGGNQGLAIFKPGFPRFVSMPCTADDADEMIDDASASPAGLEYDARSGQYIYIWKSSKAWAGACGSFELGLIDGSNHRALFHFVR
jgi:hypothetical protein